MLRCCEKTAAIPTTIMNLPLKPHIPTAKTHAKTIQKIEFHVTYSTATNATMSIVKGTTYLAAAEPCGKATFPPGPEGTG